MDLKRIYLCINILILSMLDGGAPALKPFSFCGSLSLSFYAAADVFSALLCVNTIQFMYDEYIIIQRDFFSIHAKNAIYQLPRAIGEKNHIIFFFLSLFYARLSKVHFCEKCIHPITIGIYRCNATQNIYIRFQCQTRRKYNFMPYLYVHSPKHTNNNNNKKIPNHSKNAERKISYTATAAAAVAVTLC